MAEHEEALLNELTQGGTSNTPPTVLLSFFPVVTTIDHGFIQHSDQFPRLQDGAWMFNVHDMLRYILYVC